MLFPASALGKYGSTNTTVTNWHLKWTIEVAEGSVIEPTEEIYISRGAERSCSGKQ